MKILRILILYVFFFFCNSEDTSVNNSDKFLNKSLIDALNYKFNINDVMDIFEKIFKDNFDDFKIEEQNNDTKNLEFKKFLFNKSNYDFSYESFKEYCLNEVINNDRCKKLNKHNIAQITSKISSKFQSKFYKEVNEIKYYIFEIIKLLNKNDELNNNIKTTFDKIKNSKSGINKVMSKKYNNTSSIVKYFEEISYNFKHENKNLSLYEMLVEYGKELNKVVKDALIEYVHRYRKTKKYQKKIEGDINRNAKMLSKLHRKIILSIYYMISDMNKTNKKISKFIDKKVKEYHEWVNEENANYAKNINNLKLHADFNLEELNKVINISKEKLKKNNISFINMSKYLTFQDTSKTIMSIMHFLNNKYSKDVKIILLYNEEYNNFKFSNIMKTPKQCSCEINTKSVDNYNFDHLNYIESNKYEKILKSNINEKNDFKHIDKKKIENIMNEIFFLDKENDNCWIKEKELIYDKDNISYSDLNTKIQKYTNTMEENINTVKDDFLFKPTIKRHVLSLRNLLNSIIFNFNKYIYSFEKKFDVHSIYDKYDEIAKNKLKTDEKDSSENENEDENKNKKKDENETEKKTENENEKKEEGETEKKIENENENDNEKKEEGETEKKTENENENENAKKEEGETEKKTENENENEKKEGGETEKKTENENEKKEEGETEKNTENENENEKKEEGETEKKIENENENEKKEGGETEKKIENENENEKKEGGETEKKTENENENEKKDEGENEKEGEGESESEKEISGENEDDDDDDDDGDDDDSDENDYEENKGRNKYKNNTSKRGIGIIKHLWRIPILKNLYNNYYKKKVQKYTKDIKEVHICEKKNFNLGKSYNKFNTLNYEELIKEISENLLYAVPDVDYILEALEIFNKKKKSKKKRNVFYEAFYGDNYFVTKSKGFHIESFIYPYFEALNIQLKKLKTCFMENYYECMKKYVRENLSKKKLDQKILIVYLGKFKEEIFKLPTSTISEDLKKEHLKLFLENEEEHNCFNNFLIKKYRDEYTFFESIKAYVLLHSKYKDLNKNNINFNFYVSYIFKKEIQFMPLSYYYDSIIYCKVVLATSKYGNQEIVPIDDEIIKVILLLSLDNKEKNVHYLILSEVTSDTNFPLLKNKRGIIKLYRVSFEKPHLHLINKRYKIKTTKKMKVILEKEVILNNNTKKVKDYIDTFYEIMNKIMENNINLELVGKSFFVHLNTI
ncbi:conserved Plasmodium protein, unknown function [Plasmodium relictum]|uniref:Uncharacterized protein n=1 Tax=Plasmodium relictum TaxID=85471 RepID=A0A1J1H628_PLARL|nr:conserved Plasmodium protein, unknown function [Plasmodium relictum]CRH00211.1 conserved Plasmodium protein, unknown function [Plasmodium relictum]